MLLINNTIVIYEMLIDMQDEIKSLPLFTIFFLLGLMPFTIHMIFHDWLKLLQIRPKNIFYMPSYLWEIRYGTMAFTDYSSKCQFCISESTDHTDVCTFPTSHVLLTFGIRCTWNRFCGVSVFFNFKYHFVHFM